MRTMLGAPNLKSFSAVARGGGEMRLLGEGKGILNEKSRWDLQVRPIGGAW